MQIKRGHLYVVDFNPRVKTKPGKLRPALVIQSNLVNNESFYKEIGSLPENMIEEVERRVRIILGL
jgi:mRNA-degrading endonuclease toxin of MazEF toxin-antitoxin module